MTLSTNHLRPLARNFHAYLHSACQGHIAQVHNSYCGWYARWCKMLTASCCLCAGPVYYLSTQCN